MTQQAGLHFVHQNSATSEKYLVETMGSGCAFIDYNADGWLDIFMINGGWTPGSDRSLSFDHALYKNLGNGSFEETTAVAGIRPNQYFGMGAAVADYDNDGYDDLFITNFNGPNLLYRNRGDGTFSDATQRASVGGDGQWSTSAAFLDYNQDGFLDLYVVRYVDHSFQNNRICGPWADRGFRAYCTPQIYQGIPDLLYENNGDGTFRDVSSEAGIALPQGKGLGIAVVDHNGDGREDIYVANDSVRNFLFENTESGPFRERGLISGTAFDEFGAAQAGMGTHAGDFDGDGFLDIAVTNLDLEYLALYRNLGDGLFEDVSSRTGIQLPTRETVGFGVAFLDYDNDSDLDLLVANGHILDNVARIREGASYRQRKILFENAGGHFRDVTAMSGESLSVPEVSRGLAIGDYDNDGDLDALISNCGDRAVLLRNEGGNRNSWLQVSLTGKKSNRNGIGATVTVRVGDTRLVRQVTAAGSYLSAHDYRAHFGLAEFKDKVTVTVAWPTGLREIFTNISPRQEVRLEEGTGSRVP